MDRPQLQTPSWARVGIVFALAMAACTSSSSDAPAVAGDIKDAGDLTDQSSDTGNDTGDGHEQEEVDASAKKAFGEFCDDDSECESRWCIDAKEGDICSRKCDDDCPEGMACKTMRIVDDKPVDFCTDGHLPLCRPCDFKSDCNVQNQFPDSRCHSWGNDGKFCITGCHDNFACPGGYTCTELKLDGDFYNFCMPDSGECACDDGAIEQQLSTRCYKPTALGNCEGIRYCSPEGLTECSASAPVDEICDGRDDDCDGHTDEGFSDCDGDGIKDCVDQDRDDDGVLDDGDNSGVIGDNPCAGGQKEACDDNCALCSPNPAQEDADGDGVGDLCVEDGDEDGYTPADGDCNDADDAVHPGADETCDGRDDNCDGMVDEENAVDCVEFWRDNDQDGHGRGLEKKCLCHPTDLHSATVGGDCDDEEPLVHPGATEVCDALDNDCDSHTDPPDAEGCFNFYADGDGDGFGALDPPKCLCAATAEFPTHDHSDCDDTKATTNSQAIEFCNGTDDDCDGSTDIKPALQESCPASCGSDLQCAQDCNLRSECLTTCGAGEILCFEGALLPCDAPPFSICTDPDSGCNSEFTICGECPYKSEAVCNGQDDDCDFNTDEDFVAQACDPGSDGSFCPGLESCVDGQSQCAEGPLPEGIPEEVLSCADGNPVVVVTPSPIDLEATHRIWVWTPADIAGLWLGYNDNFCAGKACAQSAPCGGKIWSWGPLENSAVLQSGLNTLKVYHEDANETLPCSTESAPLLEAEISCESCP